MKELSIEEKAKAYDKAIEIAKEINNEQRAQPFNVMTRVFHELKENEEESEDERIRGAIIDHLKDNNLTEWAAWLEKQGEQKPADKVEPKFHEEDWITDGTSVFQIVKIEGEWYIADDGERVCFDVVHQYYNLWTIQDAKDGDVLYECNEKKPFIFKELETKHIGDIASYCDIFNGIFNPNEDSWTTLDIVPATKEQHDFLFQKMKEAGYEWDADKKELRKIGQNNTDAYIEVKGLSEIEAEAEELTKEMSGEKHNLTDFERTLADICIGWIGEEPGWKEYIKDNADVLLKIAVKKFNSVQDSLFEQKPAWSEEDETILKAIILNLEECSKTCAIPSKKYVLKCIIWLKSLRPQNTWKPSEHEINIFEDVIDGKVTPCNYHATLHAMLEQLKKLREE